MNIKLYNYLVDQLIRHEGVKLKPYFDTENILTIGIGRNLEGKGLSMDEAMLLLKNDINETIDSLENMGFYQKCNDARKIVLINMAFNLGINGLLRFKKMIEAINADNYELAYHEMLDSKWSNQVKGRAHELAKIMQKGDIDD